MNVGALAPVVPVLVATVSAVVALLVQVFSGSGARTRPATVALLGLAAVAATAASQGPAAAFGGVLLADPLAVYGTLLLAVLAAASTAAARDLVVSEADTAEEYFALLLFALVGMLIMVSATELIVLFLGFETMSIAVYVLAGVWRGDRGGNEAAVKYFLLGAFASAVMVYGIALVYSAAGSTELGAVAGALSATGPAALVLGVALVLVGFAFKIAAVPFHLWTPDVYQGAPTPVTLFMATAVKAAAFIALLRVFVVALAPLWSELGTVLWALAAITMTVGNIAALRQSSMKRMLAYSAIAHTGYLLMGLAAVAASQSLAGASALFFYLMAYAAMNTAAFTVLISVCSGRAGGDSLAGLSGLARRRPGLAMVMTLAMLSLTGFPPLAGFMGKFYLFAAVLEAGLTGLVVVAVINTVISAAYYLGVVRAMYFEEAPASLAGEGPARRPLLAITTWAAALATVVLGLFPAPLLSLAEAVVASIGQGP